MAGANLASGICDFDDLRPRALERLHGLLARLRHAARGVAPLALFDPDAQPFDARASARSSEPLGSAGAPSVCGSFGSGGAHRLERAREVERRRRQRPEMRDRPGRRVPVPTHPPPGGLDPEDAVQRGRNADRPSAVRAESKRYEPRRDGHAGIPWTSPPR